MYGKSIKAGSFINRTYRVKAELGSGGNGAVFMAWHKRLRKYVVIKVIKNCSDGAVEVHRNEVEALKNIKSMHIPQVLDFFIEENRSFSVMEYIDGVSFDKLLRVGRHFTEPQIVKWYLQLAWTLDAIHKNGVCHRDIKPSNIMRTTNGDVYLIDFNSALVSGNNTGVISRSMGYASPEQYEYFKMCKSLSIDNTHVYSDFIETALLVGDCKTEPALRVHSTSCVGTHGIDWKLSDIYSLGATMYHFLTRKRPPVAAGDVALILTLKGYSEGILKVIERSMRSEPSERFSSAEELGCALRSL